MAEMIELLEGHLNRLIAGASEASLDTTSDAFKRPFTLDDLATVKRAVPLIPVLLQELVDFIGGDSHELIFKAFAGSLYSYTFNPFDVISDTFGLPGFVDDVVLVFRGMERIEAGSDTRFVNTHSQDVRRSIEACEALLSEASRAGIARYLDNIITALSPSINWSRIFETHKADPTSSWVLVRTDGTEMRGRLTHIPVEQISAWTETMLVYFRDGDAGEVGTPILLQHIASLTRASS